MNNRPVEIELRKNDDMQANEIQPGMIRKISVSIGGRTIPLRYDMTAQMQIEDELMMDFNEFLEAVRKKKNSRRVISAIRILGNRGLACAGEAADLTEEWLADHIVPMNMKSYQVAVMGATTAGWFMETDAENNKENEDDILAEIRKKNESTN